MNMIVTKTIIVLAILISTGIAQNYGKIYGTITDAETNLALPDVQILLTEKDWHVASDTAGFYILMPLSMGTYSISVTCPGYQSLTIDAVQVISNEGTQIDISLTSGQSDITDVVIQANKHWADESIPYSFSRISADDILRLPVRGLQNYMGLQPGVVIQDDQVHIRGGRDDETGYYVNGLSTIDPLSNSNAIYIIPEAIEQIRIYRGVHSSLYGGSNSGIVMTDLKQGTADYQFSFDYQTDKFAGSGNQFLDTYSYRDQIVTATAGGPLYLPNLRFFAAIENSGTGDAVKRFSEGFEFRNLIDGNPSNPLVVSGNPDTVSLFYPSGYTPINNRSRWALNSVLRWDENPFAVQMTVLYNTEQIHDNDQPMIDILNRRQQYTETNKWLLSAELTHRLRPNLYYSLSISRFINDSERLDDYFGNDWQAWDDSARVAEHTNNKVTYRRRFSEPYNFRLHGIEFANNGQTNQNYLKTAQHYTALNGHIEWQFNPGINLQAGFSWRSYTIRRFGIDQDRYMQTLSDGLGERYLRDSSEGIYGYNIRGDEVDNGPDAPREPSFGAAYLQTTWHTKNLTVLAGYRLDRFFSDDRYLTNPENPRIDSFRDSINPDEWQEKEAVTVGSPHVSIMTRAAEETRICAGYSKHVQPVSFINFYYDNHQFDWQMVRAGYFFITPIGFDLNLVHSQLFDAGIYHSFSANSMFHAGVYYKKTRGLPRVMAVVSAPTSELLNYFKITNGDNSETKGLEVEFRIRQNQNLSTRIYYTLSNAEGNGSNPLSNYPSEYRFLYQDTIQANASAPLDYLHRHRFFIDFDYQFGPDQGGPLFRNSRINLLINYESGHPFTTVSVPMGGSISPYSVGSDYELDFRSANPIEPTNSSNTPWTSRIDLYFEKSFTFLEKINSSFYLRITNLLNTKNAINVYKRNGSSESDGVLGSQITEILESFYGEKYAQLYRAINVKNGQAYWDFTGRQLFGHPRQIMLGVRLVY
jgi:hypothetical protein